MMSITANSTMKAVNISLKSIGITFRVVSGYKVTKKIKYSIKYLPQYDSVFLLRYCSVLSLYMNNLYCNLIVKQLHIICVKISY